TQRRGAYEQKMVPGSLAHRAYGTLVVSERHRHRYEFNNAYRALFEEKGMRITGTSPDGGLVEVIEMAGHPWFLAVQCHPEFKSKPTQPQPLFRDFIGAALVHRRERQKPRSAVATVN
ncbi:MAG: gamma-glutamyl-gamma-aminobutyrate hydrolase family protein, partial [Gemmataceae bacterium]|nr:gamma-glutamyl-gamma-aminobutyrate hydrolase family protein [Gemmataceae bacterium]